MTTTSIETIRHLAETLSADDATLTNAVIDAVRGGVDIRDALEAAGVVTVTDDAIAAAMTWDGMAEAVALATTKTWTDEGYWNACFGSETRESALAEAESQGITPQDYARGCVEAARGASAADGSDGFDADEAFGSLCRQLGVPVS